MISGNVMIIAGEASGDLHGANLIKALKQKAPTLQFYGIGGHRLKSAGVSILINSDELSVVGITEVLAKLPQIYKAITTIKQHLHKIKPDLLILIDYPEFNLHLAATAKKLSIPVLFYISPQIWAWRSGRVKKIKRRVDHMAVILPFEVPFYQRYNVPVTFVGHPLMDEISSEDLQQIDRSKADQNLVSLFPGSRTKEVTKHLPIMIQAANALHQKLPQLRFLISCAPSIQQSQLKQILNDQPHEDIFTIVTEDAGTLFKKSRLALAKSGTVTLQAAIYATPCIIIYKVSSLSYFLARHLIQVEFIGLANLISGRRVFPELIQDQASPQLIADTAHHMLTATHGFENLHADLIDIRKKLGKPGASERVADLALSLMVSNGFANSSLSKPNWQPSTSSTTVLDHD
ncbi:MAG: lipid-A-disaccharide synthase [Desulfobacteraceae bacterium]|jgi:lipid-A-disaccharide synthase